MAWAKQCDICGQFFKDVRDGDDARYPNRITIYADERQVRFTQIPPNLMPKDSKNKGVLSLRYDMCPSCATEIMSTISDIRKGSCFDG